MQVLKLTEYHIHPTADCKFKCYKSSNVIGCGCPYHHSHSNPRCAYNVIRQYKPNTRGLHMVVKAASDHSFRLHGMAKWSRKQRRKHIGVRMYYFVYTPMETEGGPLRATWFWRSWSKTERRFNHGRMSAPNFDDSDGSERTAPVGSYAGGRAASGIDDAFGNAWEFTADLRVESHRQLAHQGAGDGVLRDATAPGPGLRVAVRGGSFYFDLRPNPGGEWAAFVPEVRRKSAGFRCARDAG